MLRRRRLVYAGVALGALLVGAAVATTIVLTRAEASTATAVPKGYHLVPAQGPVAHATVTQYPSSLPSTVVDIATGRERPAPLVLEVWWDPKSGFDRVVGRIDGRVQFDAVGQTCQRISAPPGRFCFPPAPFDLENMHYRLPADTRYVYEVGQGSFRGHHVIWLEGLVNGHRSPPSKGSIASHSTSSPTSPSLSAASLAAGCSTRSATPFSATCPARASPSSCRTAEPLSVRFRRFQTRRSMPPRWAAQGSRRAGAGSALARASFRRPPLRAVEVGTSDAVAPNGHVLARAKFVRFDYGTVKLQEFGRDRPFGFRKGPRPGRIVVNGSAMLTRGGLLVIAGTGGRAKPIDGAAALRLAKALRPVPASS